jgi:methyl-accepting chemotaxis protein
MALAITQTDMPGEPAAHPPNGDGAPRGGSAPGAAPLDTAARDRLNRGLASLGFEIVDVAALLTAVEAQSTDVRGGLGDLRRSASDIDAALKTAAGAVTEVDEAARGSVEQASASMEMMREANDRSRRVAEWVGALDDRVADLSARLKAVEKSMGRIANIAAEVGILAINARIVAARAGEHGRGFAVVAEAISELSQQTAATTRGITEEVTGFGAAVTSIREEAGEIRIDAGRVLESGQETDAALSAIGRHLHSTQESAARLSGDLDVLTRANDAFHPVLERLSNGIGETAKDVKQGHARVEALIDLAEGLVQANAAMGGASDDAPMIALVQERAARISQAFNDGVTSGLITQADLFDSSYQPIAGSDPVQVSTRFTAFTDRVLPQIQEEVLGLDPRVVFCAAVDRNGYLPTHNRKFSQPQSADPVWNAANCRNRRIFDDRVGLKAGRSTAPFLLQVYRRDMGGGKSVLMKDLSAPIFVNGRHWGGLRLAYRPA